MSQSAKDNHRVRLRVNIAVSILALVAIVWSVRFAVAQEHRRTPQYLQGMYRELDEKFFQNMLPPARFEWADLTDKDAMGTTSQQSDDSFLIRVDRRSNFWDDEELTDTVAHEACHVSTWGAEQDWHGPVFQSCMDRIKRAQK